MKDKIEKMLVNITRQPIFDERKRVWGYELLGIGMNAETKSGFPETDMTAVKVANSAFMEMQRMAFRGKKILINFDEKSILENVPHALPSSVIALKISENIKERDEILSLLKKYKDEGFMLVVSDYSGNKDCMELYRMSDVISVNTEDYEVDDLAKRLSLILPFDGLLLSSNIDETELLNIYKTIGFSLFEGTYFKKAETMSLRKMSANQSARFHLLSIIEEEDPNKEKLAEMIQADVSLSFRLLSYLNSASFGFAQKIKSIHQAIVLLGWKKMKSWLRVILLYDMNDTLYASELLMLSVQRGKFLEEISREYDFWGFDPDGMHLLGLFSLLDAIMGMEMKQIVSYLPLEDKVKKALCREVNNEYHSLLRLTECMEEARWTEVEQLIQQLNLDGEKVKSAFMNAVDESLELSLVSA